MFCLTGPTSDLLATGQWLRQTLYFYVDQKSKMAATTGQIEFYKRSYGENYLISIFSESVEPFKRKLCLNIPWMVQSSTNFCVFWADKNSKIATIVGQSFNIGPYWGNWIDTCFQKLQTWLLPKLYTNDYWMVPDQKFICGMEVLGLLPFAGEFNIGVYGKITFWKFDLINFSETTKSFKKKLFLRGHLQKLL